MPDPLSGIRLQDYLFRCFPAARRPRLRGLIAAGAIRVNGMPRIDNVRLLAGDLVTVAAGDGDLAPRRGAAAAAAAVPPDQVEVLAETPTVLVVAKPAGLATVPDRSGHGTSVHALLAALRPDDDLRIAHRLDRDTSGCLILAKGLEAARHLDRSFRAGGVHKEYLGLVGGRLRGAGRVAERTGAAADPADPDRTAGRVDDAVAVADAAADPVVASVGLFVGPDSRRPGKVVASARPRRGFRAARTDVRVEAVFARHTLLRLLPRTGRGHQLRVHLQALGHPLVGDRDYGGGPLLLSELKPGYKLRPGVSERPLLERMFLHAEVVRFADVDGSPVAVRAPLPSDLQLALAKLRRFRPRP